ncbi:MAG TPA: hypothetical protein DHV28_00040 [Ignavibacteriales bacterium]|nr:hypothetical protein [Ignavibacteriales bacterium]
MNDYIIKVENVSYSVNNKSIFSGNESIEILRNISFSVERGKVLGISGQSGSGKSTLAKILAGIYTQTSGAIKRDFKKDWSKLLPKPVQILFQNDGDLLNPCRSVNDILNEAFELKSKKYKLYSSEINKVFTQFDINPNLRNRKGSQLSGGEKQRIALARIVIMEPEVLILDEPFSSQDVESQLNILNLINKVKENLDLTVICISHDLNILKRFSDNLIIMFDGGIVESGLTHEIINNPVNDYTKFLLSAQSLKLSEAEIHTFHNKYE